MLRTTIAAASFVLISAFVSAQPPTPRAPLPPTPPLPPITIVGASPWIDPVDMVEFQAKIAGIEKTAALVSAASVEQAQLAAKVASKATVEALAAVRGLELPELHAFQAAGVARTYRSEDGDYRRGTAALDAGRYEQAIDAFDRVISTGKERVEGALYWKAYALNRTGKRTEALTTLDDLLKRFPSGRWTNDARSLQAEVRQASGQAVAPDRAQDEELKVMALNSLMRSDADRALPMIEKVLQGSDSPKVKDKALFVLAQNGSPQAREALARIARGQGNPDLQMKAVKYLALFGGNESRQTLSDVYTGTTDLAVKREVLQAFMLAGDRDRLLNAARSEKVAELRATAVKQLGIMGASAELGQLYRTEVSVQVKEQVLRAIAMSGAMDQLQALARAEADAALRRTAVRDLGIMGGKKTADALVQFYREDKDPSVRKAAIEGLFIQQNAAALVELARSENDPELKKAIVSRLSLIKSKESTDYMMELLNKK